MEYYKGKLCVSYKELVDGGIVSGANLRQMAVRGKIDVVRRASLHRCALIAVDSLPEKYRAQLEALQREGKVEVPRPDDKGEEKEEMKRLIEDSSAREYYEAWVYVVSGVETHLSRKLIEKYTKNASVVKMLAERMDEMKARGRSSGRGRKGDCMETLLRESEKLRSVTGHTLPGSKKRLGAMIAKYRKDGYGALISGNVGNDSTMKLTEEAGQRLIALKRSKVPVLTDAQIFAQYNSECETRGWKKLQSIRTLENWLKRPDIEPLWWDAVYGEMSAHQRYDRRHKTALPQRRDTLWYGDGTKINLYYRGEDGKVRTTSVYEVIDAATEVFLGFSISDKEDYEAQYMAYRMAIQVSAHKPYEIVHDNQGGHKKLQTQRFFDRICHVHRTTAPYNGASKTIESVFGRFQAQVLHKDWRFSGQNITAKKENSRPNLEFIEANKDKLYTLTELKQAYVKARTEWNEMAHPATGRPRIEMYEEGVNSETPVVTASEMVDMFWVESDRMSTFTSSGIEITVSGHKRRYEVMSSPGVPDTEWRRRHTGERFVVKYDPYDFSSIRLYRKDKAGELRFERVAEPYIVIHRAILDQSEGEAAFIRAQQKAAEESRIERQVEGRQIEIEEGTAPEQNGLSSPRLKGARSELQRQIESRLRKYGKEPAELTLGRMTKKISNMDWSEELKGREAKDIEPVKIDRQKMAGKL